MSEHTPGPWEYIVDGDWPMIYSAAHDEDGHRLPVADLFHGGYDYADLGYPLAANARLIACAPEMLAMLIRYRNETPLGNQPHMIAHKADALIAKARGA